MWLARSYPNQRLRPCLRRRLLRGKSPPASAKTLPLKSGLDLLGWVQGRETPCVGALWYHMIAVRVMVGVGVFWIDQTGVVHHNSLWLCPPESSHSGKAILQNPRRVGKERKTNNSKWIHYNPARWMASIPFGWHIPRHPLWGCREEPNPDTALERTKDRVSFEALPL